MARSPASRPRFLERLLDWLQGPGPIRPRLTARPALERLEERDTPSTFTVTNTSGSPSVTGSLPFVVAQANADTTGTAIVINFASASGQPFATAQTIKLAATLDLHNTQAGASITIQGPAKGVTIDGGGKTSDFSVFKVEAGTTASLDGLTIANGFTTNVADVGAGIDNQGTLTVSDVTLTGNTVTGGADAGGIMNGFGATLTVTNATLTDNRCDGSGGAIENFGTATLTGVTVTNNIAGTNGGGIENGGTLTVTNSTLSGNAATGTGGGIDNDDSTLTVYGSALLDNTAASGGGVYNGNHSTMTLADDTLAGNTAGAGGGAFNDIDSTLAVSDCTLTGNTASGQTAGGGIANFNTLLLNSTIVANNVGTVSTDIYDNGAAITGGHNLVGVAGNLSSVGLTDGQNGNIIGHPALVANLGNLGGSTETVGLLPGSPALAAGGAVTTVAQAANTTTTTLTLTNAAAIASTPGQVNIVIDGEEMTVTAVNLSTNTVTVTRGVNGQSASPSANDSVFLFADQRGVARTATGGDIGAFESKGFVLSAAASATPQSADINASFAKPLAVTVTANDTGVNVTGGLIAYTVTAGTGGQSATLSAATATIGANGQASVTATANGTLGAYTVTAATGSATATFNLTNVPAPPQAPTFTSPAKASFTVGTQSTFTVTANGNPAPMLSEQAGETPPNGLTFTPATGQLSGMPTTAGTYTLHFAAANSAGSKTQTLTVTVNKGAQTTTFAALPAATFGNADFALSATASSGLPVTYTASGHATVSLVAGVWMVHITGAGSAIITAHQAGNSNFSAAATVSQTLTINKATPTFSSLSSPTITDGSNPAKISGQVTAGTLAATGSVVITITGNGVTLTATATLNASGDFSTVVTRNWAVGTYTVTYHYAGAANFNAITPDGSTTLDVT